MELVIGNVCAGAPYTDSVQVTSAFITKLTLADARFYSRYNLVLLQKAVVKLLIFFSG